jgi:hypothetical protein
MAREATPTFAQVDPVVLVACRTAAWEAQVARVAIPISAQVVLVVCQTVAWEEVQVARVATPTFAQAVPVACRTAVWEEALVVRVATPTFAQADLVDPVVPVEIQVVKSVQVATRTSVRVVQAACLREETLTCAQVAQAVQAVQVATLATCSEIH